MITNSLSKLLEVLRAERPPMYLLIGVKALLKCNLLLGCALTAPKT
jgi:hypothetical protein